MSGGHFDFHARYALLTYAQCGDLDPFTIVDHLAKIPAECIIGRELHNDGGIHLHVFIDLGRKRRFRRADKFDVQNRHPNIEPSRGTPWDGYDYAIKDGDIVAGGLARPESRDTIQRDGEIWSIIVAAETRDEYWELIRVLAPKSLCNSFSNLSRYADWKYASKLLRYRTPDGTFEPTNQLTAWVQGNIQGLEGGLPRGITQFPMFSA